MAAPDDPESKQMLSIQRSAQHLADHFEVYPMLLFSFVQYDPTGGSIFPATWSAMLAARAEGVGTALTSVFHFEIQPVLEILGVPSDEGWLFSSCVTFGYPTGRWGVAPRRPVHEVVVPQSLGNGPRLRDPRTAVAAESVTAAAFVPAIVEGLTSAEMTDPDRRRALRAALWSHALLCVRLDRALDEPERRAGNDDRARKGPRRAHP